MQFRTYFFAGFLKFLLGASWIGYTSAFIGMIFEGDIVLFTMAFFTREGFFNPLLMFITVFAGVIIGDILWYKLGKRLASSGKLLHKFFINLTEASDRHLLERPFHTIFVSKFAYGIHHLILMRAGAINVPLNRFIRDDMRASLVWILIVGSLGYFSSYSFEFVKHSLKFAEIILLISVVFFVLAERFILRQFKKEL